MKKLFYWPKSVFPFYEVISFKGDENLFLVRSKETVKEEKIDVEPPLPYKDTNSAVLFKYKEIEEKGDEGTDTSHYVFTMIDDGFKIEDGDSVLVFSGEYIRLMKFEGGFNYVNDDELKRVYRACRKWWNDLGRK